jgi:hypothetical protein
MELTKCLCICDYNGVFNKYKKGSSFYYKIFLQQKYIDNGKSIIANEYVNLYNNNQVFTGYMSKKTFYKYFLDIQEIRNNILTDILNEAV